jgi:hypothetical protein
MKQLMKIRLNWLFCVTFAVGVIASIALNIVAIRRQSRLAAEIENGAELKRIQRAMILNLRGPEFDGKSLESCLQYKPVSFMALKHTAISDCEFIQLSSHPNLSSVGCIELISDKMTSAVFEGFRHFVELSELEFNLANPIDERIGELRSNINLQVLDVSSNQLTDRGYAALGTIRSLVSLDLAAANIDDRHLVRFRKLDQLRVLDLHFTALTGSGMDAIWSLSSLEEVDLTDCIDFRDRGLSAIRHSHSLRKIDLGGTPITDDGAKHLLECEQLEEVNLCGTRVSEGFVGSFSRKRPSVLVHSDFGSFGGGETGIPKLRNAVGWHGCVVGVP